MIDITPALLDAASGRRRPEPAVLYREQARSLREAAQMEVGALLRRRAKEEGFSRQQLVEHLGYQNANKGLRRVDAMFGGKKPGQLRQRLAELLQVTEEVEDIIDVAESRSQELQSE